MKFSIISYISIRAIARRFRKEESIENPRVMVRFPKTLHAKAKAARIDGCKQDRYYADSVSISLKRSRGHGGGNPYLGSARSNQSCSRATNCRLLMHWFLTHNNNLHCSSPFHHDREETKDLLSCRDRLQHTKTSIPIFSRDQDMLILMIGTFKNCGKRKNYASQY